LGHAAESPVELGGRMDDSTQPIIRNRRKISWPQR
jgi:hypothetical protein